jgi:hypothetical protein
MGDPSKDPKWKVYERAMARSRLRACDICSTWSSAHRDYSTPSPLLQRVQLLVGQQQGERDRRRDASKGLRSSTPVFLLQFLGGLPFVATQLGDQQDHAGSMRVTSRSASFPL